MLWLVGSTPSGAEAPQTVGPQVARLKKAAPLQSNMASTLHPELLRRQIRPRGTGLRPQQQHSYAIHREGSLRARRGAAPYCRVMVLPCCNAFEERFGKAIERRILPAHDELRPPVVERRGQSM